MRALPQPVSKCARSIGDKRLAIRRVTTLPELSGFPSHELDPASQNERGGDLLIGTYNYLDLAPKGRNEEGEHRGWVRRHDEY